MGLLEDRITEVTHNNQALGRPVLTREGYDEMCRNSRLSMPSFVRIPGAAVAGFSIGMSLGLSMGSKMAGLRFRAEHAHKLPTTTAGWYLYHKSKNYHLAFGGLKEGLRTGARLSVLTTAMFCAENLFDVYRGSKDMFNTVGASLAVAGGFSLISRSHRCACVPCCVFAVLSLACMQTPVSLPPHADHGLLHRQIFSARDGQNGAQRPAVRPRIRRRARPAQPDAGPTGRLRRVYTQTRWNGRE